MGFSDKWIVDLRTQLLTLRPGGPTSAIDAQDLPALSPLDTIAVVGQIGPPVKQALVNFNRSANNGDESNVAMPSSKLTDGQPNDGLFAAALLPGDGISATVYLGAYGNPGAPHQRGLTAGAWALGQTYEVWAGTLSSETNLLVFVRQLMADWQRLCDASAAAILAHGPDLTSAWQLDEADEFWSALGAVCSDLDVLAENPPIDIGAKLAGALKAALHASEEFVGKAAAEVSEEVGKAAGNVAEGFFSQAGLLAVAVAGIALYLYVK